MLSDRQIGNLIGGTLVAMQWLVTIAAEGHGVSQGRSSLISAPGWPTRGSHSRAGGRWDMPAALLGFVARRARWAASR